MGEWESEYLSYVGTTKCYFSTQNISTNIVYRSLVINHRRRAALPACRVLFQYLMSNSFRSPSLYNDSFCKGLVMGFSISFQITVVWLCYAVHTCLHFHADSYSL